MRSMFHHAIMSAVGERKWYETNKAGAAGYALLMIIFLVTIGPDTVREAIEDPSIWRLFSAAVLLVLLVVYSKTAVRRWFTPDIDAADIPIEDVRASVDATNSRVDAVTRLRMRHPDLRLGDASHLVNNVVDEYRR